MWADVWDNPRLLNAGAGALVALAALLLAYASLQLLLRTPMFPLREVVVRTGLAHAPRAQIAEALADAGGNFFAADLAALRARLEGVPWVRRVELRRVWPDRIEVGIEEHVALARWGDEGLVNTFGEPFAGRLEDGVQAQLPLFAGPTGSAAVITRRYRRFAELLAPLGETPQRVILTPRHAWQLRLASGLNVELGRDGAEPVERRLARLVAAWPDSLGRLSGRAGGGAEPQRTVDLRYPNGFALRVAGWKG